MKHKFFAKITLAVALAIFSSTAAMGQRLRAGKGASEKSDTTVVSKGKKVLDTLTEHIQLHGYAQGGYSYTNRSNTNTNSFELKRILFWANAQINDRWSFLFMHDFSSVVQEFYTDFRITNNKALNVRLGQFKNGLSLENPLSPTSMEAIDVYSEGVTYLAGCGSDPLMGVQYGRDLGLALYGETNNAKFHYELDVMNGQGINKKDGNNFKDFIGRIEYRPARGLNLVATGQIGRGHSVADSVIVGTGGGSVFNPTIRKGDDYKRNRWTVGFDYKCKKVKLHGEYLEGYDGKVTSRGGYLTGSVPLGRPDIEFVGSYDYFNYNTSLGYDQHKAIAGIQYWFYQKCRIQLQYVYKSAYATKNAFIRDNSHAIMCQVQVRFN